MKLRSVPTVVLGGLIGVVALAGTADATVHYLAMGGYNKTATTTTLYDTAGTPLYLKAPSTKPPLSVSNKVQVPNLNASYLGGLSKSAFTTTAQAQAIANAAAANVQSHVRTFIGAFTGGKGVILCPHGHPLAGGSIPDQTGASAPPYLVTSAPSIDLTTGIENGWLVGYSGGTGYDGKGAIWVACSDISYLSGMPTPSPSPSTSSSP